MPANQYVNIHAHRLAEDASEWVLSSMSVNDFSPETISDQGHYSLGLHPWHILNADIQESMRKIQTAIENNNVLAIGETGLDKSIDTPFEVQIKVFEQQIELAEQEQLPVIIHAVRSNQEMIKAGKIHAARIPMIIHGFRGGLQLANDMLKAGFYLSVGHALLSSEKLQEAIKAIPLDSLFIETDESPVPITVLYDAVADLRKIDPLKLREHMLVKTARLFT